MYNSSILPMPSIEENKAICQLDIVTKQSEEKASEIFDILDSISSNFAQNMDNIEKIINLAGKNIFIFDKLCSKYPDVKIFKSLLQKNKRLLNESKLIKEVIENFSNKIIEAINILQYQDIYRQKVERVINVMESLSKYMDRLLDSQVDDVKRVSSPKHIYGDNNEDTLSHSDIENLIEFFHSNPNKY